MKAIMLSIKPEYCHLIAKGEKTIEVRKSKPKQVDVPFKCYIYCTSKDLNLGLLTGQGSTDLIVCSNWKTAILVGGEIANGKVIGEFTCDYIREAPRGQYHSIGGLSETALDPLDLMDYADDKTIYGWHISDFRLYAKPKVLNEFCRCISGGEYLYCEHLHNCWPHCYKGLKHPPQSWCYVDEVTV